MRSPAILPLLPMGYAGLPPSEQLASTARHHLASQGLTECLSLRFSSRKTIARMLAAEGSPEARPVMLRNPLSEEWECLPTSVLAGLLESASRNQRNQLRDLRLFEIAKAFFSAPELRSPRHPGVLEEERLALLLTGNWQDCTWVPETRPVDFPVLKGLVENLFALFGREISFAPGTSVPYLHPRESARVLSHGETVGWFGSLHPRVALNFELSGSVLAGEFRLGTLATQSQTRKTFTAFSGFAAVERHMNILVDEAMTHADLIAAMPLPMLPHLESVRLNSIYQGPSTPVGKKALHYSFIYRHPERTLTDIEVNTTHLAFAAELMKDARLSDK